MSPLPRPSWKLLTSFLRLSFVPVVAGVVRLSGLASGANGGGVTTEKARFVAMPAAVALHIVCASLFCVLGALQFDRARRRSFSRLHHIAGRVAAPCGIVAGPGGLVDDCCLRHSCGVAGPVAVRTKAGIGELTGPMR